MKSHTLRIPSSMTLLALALAAGLLSGCAGPEATAGAVSVVLEADGKRRSVSIPAGSTVQQALAAAGVTLGELDRVQPPGYTVIAENTEIQVTRVEERFEIETNVLPFERQTVRNEALPAGETRLIQPGENGLQEITYRVVIEEGKEVSRTPVKVAVIQQPKPEIVMVGAQSLYAPVPLEGILAYAAGGNAWIMRGDSGNRRPIIVTADLDGRVFKLSPDGRWLLFSRAVEDDEQVLNRLYVVSTTKSDAQPIDLGVENVVHFADWSPALPSFTVAYSTVEPSPSPPGWQANNDLQMVTFTSSGHVVRRRTLIPSNAGGQYGWWGTSYTWAADGLRLAYAQADSVGYVDLREPDFTPLLEFVPFQTGGDWAWVPTVSWGPRGETLYLVSHGAPVGLESQAASPVFDLTALPLDLGTPLPLVERAGMFASPSAFHARDADTPEPALGLAYLQARNALESEDSGYDLMLLDWDGSNRRHLFPAIGEPGLEPQHVVWSPSGDRIALRYRGDLWLVDVGTGLGQPLTADGQVVALDWKP